MNKAIYIDQILLYYDTIQLFVGLDAVQTRYLCMLYADNDQDKYLAIRTSTNKLASLFSGQIDLRSLYLNPEISNEYYSLTIVKEQEFEIIDKFENVEEYMLPEEDAFVIPQSGYADIIQERINCRKPIIHLGFIDANNSHDIKASILSPLIASYQEFVINTHKKISNTPESRQINPELYIFNTSAASFNLHMYIQDNLDLFGGSNMDHTLNYIDEILNFKDEQSLTNHLNDIKGYAITHYKRFIKGLIDNNISIKTAWTTSDIDNPVAHNHVSTEKLQQAYNVIQQSIELEKETQELTGYFLKVDSTNGDWKLYDEINEQLYKGKCLDPGILSGIRIRFTYYKIYCSKTAEKQNVTNKLIETLYIEQIEELKKD